MLEVIGAKDYQKGSTKFLTTGLSVISSFALLLIGSLGAAGVIPGSAVGWAAIGLGGSVFALTCAQGTLSQRKWEILVKGLISIALIIIGALGSKGMISMALCSGGIIGGSLALLAFHFAWRGYEHHRMIKGILNQPDFN